MIFINPILLQSYKPYLFLKCCEQGGGVFTFINHCVMWLPLLVSSLSNYEGRKKTCRMSTYYVLVQIWMLNRNSFMTFNKFVDGLQYFS